MRHSSHDERVSNEVEVCYSALDVMNCADQKFCYPRSGGLLGGYHTYNIISCMRGWCSLRMLSCLVVECREVECIVCTGP